jgi:hypothetical protein
LRRHDPQHHLRRRKILPRCRKISAQVEEIILDRLDLRALVLPRHRGNRQAERAVQLIDLADRDHARIVLGQARSIDEASGAVVARAGVNAVEPDQRSGLICRC